MTTHRAFGPEWLGHVPYAIVAVDMADGVRLVGPYLGTPAEVGAGLDVIARTYESEGHALLGFERATR